MAKAWLGLQVIGALEALTELVLTSFHWFSGLLFEYNLWREARSGAVAMCLRGRRSLHSCKTSKARRAHVTDGLAMAWPDVVAKECLNFHGICGGPSWNTSFFEEFSLTGQWRAACLACF